MDQDLGTSRQQLLKSLRGRSLIVPDLQSLFDHWPQSVNPEEKVRTSPAHYTFVQANREH